MTHKVLVNDLSVVYKVIYYQNLYHRPEQMILFQTFKTQPVPRGGDKETVCKTTLRIRFGPGCYQSLLRGRTVEVEGGPAIVLFTGNTPCSLTTQEPLC